MSVLKDTMEVSVVDKDLLYYEMKRKKLTAERLCEKIGISLSAFYRKCKGTSEFTHSEIQAIVDILELESPVPIFFSCKVS